MGNGPVVHMLFVRNSYYVIRVFEDINVNHLNVNFKTFNPATKLHQHSLNSKFKIFYLNSCQKISMFKIPRLKNLCLKFVIFKTVGFTVLIQPSPHNLSFITTIYFLNNWHQQQNHVKKHSKKVKTKLVNKKHN